MELLANAITKDFDEEFEHNKQNCFDETFNNSKCGALYCNNILYYIQYMMACAIFQF